jgi:3'-5' exoribonuclease
MSAQDNFDMCKNDIRTAINTLPEVLKRMCTDVFTKQEFQAGYGSAIDSKHPHHNYSGGLLVHTAEVLTISLNIAAATASLKQVDRNVLITAAVFHDYEKIRDYDRNGNKTEYRELVRHVAGSFAHFHYLALAYKLGFDAIAAGGLYNKISHCILAHHGRQEWGSPILPQTVEAQILHDADYLSMSYGRFRESL